MWDFDLLNDFARGICVNFLFDRQRLIRKKSTLWGTD
jgi:hypothetical protein